MTKPLTIKKAHFAGKDCAIGQGFVSNGHWAIRTAELVNAALFANDTDGAACRAAFPGVHVRPLPSMTFEQAAGTGVWAWTTTTYLYSVGGETSRILSDGHGAVALIDVKYLAMVGADDVGATFYSTADGRSPFRNAADVADATVILMPRRTDGMPAFPTTCVPAVTPKAA